MPGCCSPASRDMPRRLRGLHRGITPRCETAERLVHGNQAPEFNPDIDAAAGKRQLDRAGQITKLPATDLKNIQMFAALAEGNLQRGMQLSQKRLFGDHGPANDRRRHAAQPGV